MWVVCRVRHSYRVLLKPQFLLFIFIFRTNILQLELSMCLWTRQSTAAVTARPASSLCFEGSVRVHQGVHHRGRKRGSCESRHTYMSCMEHKSQSSA